MAMQKHVLMRRKGDVKRKCAIHKFRRAEWNPNFYACVESFCTSFYLRSQIKGKLARCNGCNEPFILDNYSLTVVFPKCVNCRATENNLLTRKLQKLFPAMREEFPVDRLQESWPDPKEFSLNAESNNSEERFESDSDAKTGGET